MLLYFVVVPTPTVLASVLLDPHLYMHVISVFTLNCALLKSLVCKLREQYCGLNCNVTGGHGLRLDDCSKGNLYC